MNLLYLPQPILYFDSCNIFAKINLKLFTNERENNFSFVLTGTLLFYAYLNKGNPNQREKSKTTLIGLRLNHTLVHHVENQMSCLNLF